MSPSNSQKVNLSSSIDSLFATKKSKTLENLKNAGIKTVFDLLWVLPLRLEKIPPLHDFSSIVEGHYFRGVGLVKNIQKRSSSNVRGKGKVPLQNVSVIVKDFYSDRFVTLRWFNTYPSITKKIEETECVSFLGKIQDFNGVTQIVNPDITPLEESELNNIEVGGDYDLKIQYPTVNKTKSFNLKKAIDKIPAEVWNSIPELIDEQTLKNNNFLSLPDSFKLLHGKIKDSDEEKLNQAKSRLIFEEFFIEQAKLLLRRNDYKKEEALIIKKSDKDIFALFPHPFTEDQSKALDDIQSDLLIGEPMMRMVQGDVGCGKTWVAFASIVNAIENKFQSALMCPTESLARQHYMEAQELLEKSGYKIRLLLGNTKAKEKKEIYKACENGEIDLVIGTHSLIQKDLKFKNLGFVVIDEQHKFGVEQRIKLISKGKGCHCLIMTATPIPRSLSLTQYGDLDITTIKSMPKFRSGFKTRIVTDKTFEQFLSFLKTRLSLNEQAYIVVPAIEDNEEMDINNLEQVYEKFKKFFPENIILPLHGKMAPTEKENAFFKFKNGEINVLIATSVVEVGINVPNATIMAILNPERFGLSSLHQLRGRVGRGEKVGFCFLIIDKTISRDATQRLEYVEKTSDGFKIAEEDLKNRGQGDILGKDQSGTDSFKRLANPIIHRDLLEKARETLLLMSDNPVREFQEYLDHVSNDVLIHNTI